MPPKFKFTRDEITNAALNVTRKNGISGLTARALAAELGCSVKPIFGLFKNMEEVGQEVFIASDLLYQNYLREDMAKGKYPPYKASGMAYIRFAKEERELFKLLFMRDRSREKIEENKEEIRPLMQLIQQNLGISEDMAKGKYPPYKASGMAYIRFAKEERELFKLLFMRDRSREKIEENKEEIRPLMQLIQQNLGISEDEAYLFHLEMWLYVHGIATMIATSYLDWDDEFISRVLTDAYMGLKYRYTEGKDNAGN